MSRPRRNSELLGKGRLECRRMPSLLQRLVDTLEICAPYEIVFEAEHLLTGSGMIQDVGVWVADVARTRLTDMTGRGGVMDVEGSPMEEPILTGRPSRHSDRLYLPLRQRGLVMGVLSGKTDEPDTSELMAAATILGHALSTSRMQSDDVPLARGEGEMTLPATIQQELLPNPAYEDGRVQIAGGVEPAYEVAGDVFDYSVGRDHVDLAVFDAIGHGLRSALIASVTVGGYRRLRRSGASLADIVTGVEGQLAQVLRTGEFVTGIVARLYPGGRLEICNAGHLQPLLIRQGELRSVDTGDSRPPFGLDTSGTPSDIDLQRGDSLVLTTDGVVEARNQQREVFGQSRLSDILLSELEATPSQLTRSILRAVTSHVHDPLADDATVLVVQRPAQKS